MLFAIVLTLLLVLAPIAIFLFQKKQEPTVKKTTTPASTNDSSNVQDQRITPQQFAHLPPSSPASPQRPDPVIALLKGKDWSGTPVISLSASTKGALASLNQDDHVIRIYHAKQIQSSGKREIRPVTTIDLGSSEFGTCIALNANGTLLAVGLYYLNRLRLYKLEWKSDNTSCKATMVWSEKQNDQAHFKTISHLSITQNNKYIISICKEEDRIYVWSVDNAKMLSRYNTGQLQLNMLNVSPNGTYVSVASFMSYVRVFEVVPGDSQVQLVKHVELKFFNSSIRYLSFHRENELVASCTKDNRFKICSIRRMKKHVASHTICLLALGNDVTTKESDALLLDIPTSEIHPTFTSLSIVTYSPYGDHILVAQDSFVGFCSTVHAYHPTAFKKGGIVCNTVIQVPSPVLFAEYMSDHLVALGCKDGIVRIVPIPFNS